MGFRIPPFLLGALLATTLCIMGLLFISPEAPTMWLWEALIAISFIVWRLGAGLFPSNETDRERSKSELENQDRMLEKDLDKAGVSADISAIIRVIRAEGRANRNEERKEDNEGRIRETITIVFIGITMGAIVLQVHEMVKAYGPIHDQALAAIDQAKAAVEQAKVAGIEAQGMKDQAKVAQDASIAAGRAWVGPSGATMNAAPTAQKTQK